jgi:hypothetical protein
MVVTMTVSQRVSLSALVPTVDSVRELTANVWELDIECDREWEVTGLTRKSTASDSLRRNGYLWPCLQ